MKHILLIIGLLLTAGNCKAQTIAEQSAQAWLLSGNGTKPVECYFWSIRNQASTVACAPLKHPTDEIAIIVPAIATDVYHTHPKNFPELSEVDKAAQRKSKIRIHIICSS